MPNWAENRLIIKGSTLKLTELLLKYTSTHDENELCIDFNLIAPTPIELTNNSSPVSSEELAKTFKEKYGAEDWYHWNCDNWGTKWNARAISLKDNGNSLEFEFDTAWSPPIPIIQKLSKLFPDLKLTLTYAESGMGFAGREVYEKGHRTLQKYTEDPKDKLFKDFGINYDEEEDEDPADVGERNLGQEL